MNIEYEMVKQFHKKFGHPVANKPTKLSNARVRKRCKWKNEEIIEMLEAETLADQADAAIDLMYFCIGSLVEMGIRPARMFDIVHAANMDKMWPDGSVRRNKTGKIIKPPGWKTPEPALRAEIHRQRKQ